MALDGVELRHCLIAHDLMASLNAHAVAAKSRSYLRVPPSHLMLGLFALGLVLNHSRRLTPPEGVPILPNPVLDLLSGDQPCLLDLISRNHSGLEPAVHGVPREPENFFEVLRRQALGVLGEESFKVLGVHGQLVPSSETFSDSKLVLCGTERDPQFFMQLSGVIFAFSSRRVPIRSLQEIPGRDVKCWLRRFVALTGYQNAALIGPSVLRAAAAGEVR